MAWSPGDKTFDSIEDMMNDPSIKAKTQADYGKKPFQITIGPADIDEGDLDKMKLSDFGNKALAGVRDDAARHRKQRDLAAKRGENNEPVVLQSHGRGKYKVVEGFHRLMAYFYQCCPDHIRYHIDSPNQTDWNVIDFSKWPRINVNAYVGTPFSGN